MREFDWSALRFWFSGQRWVVHFETTTFDNPNVGRNTVSKFNLYHVTDDDVFGTQRQFFALSDDQGKLRNKIHDVELVDRVLESGSTWVNRLEFIEKLKEGLRKLDDTLNVAFHNDLARIRRKKELGISQFQNQVHVLPTRIMLIFHKFSRNGSESLRTFTSGLSNIVFKLKRA